MYSDILGYSHHLATIIYQSLMTLGQQYIVENRPHFSVSCDVKFCLFYISNQALEIVTKYIILFSCCFIFIRLFL